MQGFFAPSRQTVAIVVSLQQHIGQASYGIAAHPLLPLPTGCVTPRPAARLELGQIQQNKDQPEVLKEIRDFLSSANTVRIPYRENRAVLFHSNPYHQSDRPRFLEGYRNRRMNVTLLFGNGYDIRLKDLDT
jgi:hypothetical protein